MLTPDERLAALEGEHIGEGAKTYKVGHYLTVREDGGKIQILGGAHGCKVKYIYAWYQQRWNFSWKMADRVGTMNEHFHAMVKTEQSTRFDNTAAWAKVAELNNWMDESGIDHWNESGVIGIPAGESFTIINREDWFAEEYFIEVKGKIQWAFAFEVLKEGYEEGLPWDDFGSDVTDHLELEGAHRKFLKAVRFWEGVPAGFEHEPEEEGGWQVEREDPLTEQIGDWWDEKAFPMLRGMAKAALLVVLVVVFIFLLIMFQAPIRAVMGHLTPMLIDALKRS